MTRETIARLWGHPWSLKWGRWGLNALAVLAAWCWFHYGHSRTIRDDKWLSTLIATCLLLAIVLSHVITRRYTLRALGTLDVVAASLLFYGGFMVILWGWWTPAEWTQELLRAFVLVGAPLMIVGMLWDAWLWRRAARDVGDAP
jgi:hypothetical protein